MSPVGFRRIGFISVIGCRPHASACAACARPISPPPGQTIELFDMFCALNGATRRPMRRRYRHTAVATQLLPTWEPVPPMNMGLAVMKRARAIERPVGAVYDRAQSCGQ